MHPTQAQALEALKDSMHEMISASESIGHLLGGANAVRRADDAEAAMWKALDVFAALSSPSSTVMDEKGEREAFDRWFKEEHGDRVPTDNQWQAFRAGLRALTAPAPSAAESVTWGCFVGDELVKTYQAQDLAEKHSERLQSAFQDGDPVCSAKPLYLAAPPAPQPTEAEPSDFDVLLQEFEDAVNEYRDTDPGDKLECVGAQTLMDQARIKLRSHVAALQAEAPVAEPVALNAGLSEVFLCRAWGESDHPCAELVSDWNGVREFMIREWTGDAEATAYDGTPLLDQLKGDFDEHEADERGGPHEVTFEIGGVSVERLSVFVSAPSAAEDAKDAERKPLTDEQIRSLYIAEGRYYMHATRQDIQFARTIERAHGIVDAAMAKGER